MVVCCGYRCSCLFNDFSLLRKLDEKKFLFGIVFLLSAFLLKRNVPCVAALESEEGGVKAEAVNDGIVYLMAIPYILVGVLGFAIYRLKYGKKREKSVSNETTFCFILNHPILISIFPLVVIKSNNGFIC